MSLNFLNAFDSAQITNAQLDALRIENQSLRDISGSQDTLSNTQDMRHAELQLQELKNMHKQHTKESQVLQVSTHVPLPRTWRIQRYCRLVLMYLYLEHGGYKVTVG